MKPLFGKIAFSFQVCDELLPGEALKLNLGADISVESDICLHRSIASASHSCTVVLFVLNVSL